MVDFVPKVNPETDLIQKTKDALDEEKRQGAEEEDLQQEKKSSDQFGKGELKGIFDKKSAWQKTIEIKVEDIDRIKFLGVNYKTDPSLLKIRVFLYDGSVINTAFLFVARTLALKLKNLASSAYIDVNWLTRESALKFTIPVDEKHADEEITRVTQGAGEKSFSQKLKNLIVQRTWAQKLGLKNPDTGELNVEIVWVYVTVLVLALAFVAGTVFLLF